VEGVIKKRTISKNVVLLAQDLLDLAQHVGDIVDEDGLVGLKIGVVHESGVLAAPVSASFSDHIGVVVLLLTVSVQVVLTREMTHDGLGLNVFVVALDQDGDLAKVGVDVPLASAKLGVSDTVILKLDSLILFWTKNVSPWACMWEFYTE
jgi:hypothetical protein